RSPPAVSNLGPVAGTVLGTVRNIERGALRASSSIHSMPLASQTFPISWLSQNMVVVPFRSAGSAYAHAVIIELSMWMCGSTRPGATMPPRASNRSTLAPFGGLQAPAGLIAAILPHLIQISRDSWIRSVYVERIRAPVTTRSGRSRPIATAASVRVTLWRGGTENRVILTTTGLCQSPRGGECIKGGPARGCELLHGGLVGVGLAEHLDGEPEGLRTGS